MMHSHLYANEAENRVGVLEKEAIDINKSQTKAIVVIVESLFSAW